VPEDLFALAEDCLLHRMRLNYEALADGLTTARVLEELLSDLGAPKPHRNGAVLPTATTAPHATAARPE